MNAAVARQRAARARASRSRAALALAPLAFACQTLLGMDELSTDPRAAAPASVASAGNGGGAATGVAGSGATSALPAGLDVPAAGGSAGTGADMDAVADAGPILGDATAPDAAAPPPTTVAVSGRVIDFYRHPVPDVPVSIGEQTVASDAEGRFSIAGVDVPYDVSLVLDFTRDGVPARYGYVYQDLTRADPTLQVYTALPQRAALSLDVTFDVLNFDTNPERGIIFGFASPDTEYADASLSNGSTSILGGLSWAGPITTTGNAHVLLVTRPGGVEGAPPLAYEAHAATPLIADNDAIAAPAFTLEPGSLPAATITGSVSGDTLGDRSNLVALRFADGTSLPLIEEYAPGGAFSYLVPQLPDASLVVAASQGFVTPFALVWQDGITAGQSGVALALPSPVRLGAPQPDTTVTPETRFSWSRPSGAARTFLWHAELDSATYQGIFVATARTEIGLPRLYDGFTVPPGSGATWSVETHGDLPDVDAMTGPDGFLDPFSIPPQTYPFGQRRGGGSYTESTRSHFTVSGN